METTKIKPKLENEKHEVDGEKFCSAFENWCKKNGINVNINKVIHNLQARGSTIEREELYKVIGAVTKKKKGEISDIIDLFYDKFKK